jgi:PTH1 family peptidyl-tRNA hydrolase
LRVVVGLGNPGNKYKLTRHNVGFLILDAFASKHNLIFQPSKFDFFISEGSIGPSDFFLVKPATYMNLSGLAVLDLVNQHHPGLDELLIVVDDINLPLGQIRLRKTGSDGGHNGIKSIIYHLQSDSFPRLRFGIGDEFAKGEMADFVLSEFSETEIKSIEKSIDFSLNLIEAFINDGFQSMLNHFSKFGNMINKKEIEKPENGKQDGLTGLFGGKS